jgi:hypothetical protein
MVCHANRQGLGAMTEEDLTILRKEVARLWQVIVRVGNDDGRALGAAREFSYRLLEADPTFSVSRLRQYLGPYQRSEFVESYAEGLRRAGLPEVSLVIAGSN